MDELTPTTIGQWAARGADDGTVSTLKVPNQEIPDDVGNDALAGGELEESSAAPTDGPRYGEVPKAEYLEVMPAVGKQGDGGDSEAASRFSKVPEDGRYQEDVSIADRAQRVQQTTSIHQAPAAENGLHADSEENLSVVFPNDPLYREALIAEHVEVTEPLLSQNHRSRESIAVEAAATEK